MLKTNKYSQYTTIKIIIFCTCKEPIKQKQSLKGYQTVVLQGHKKFLVEGNPPRN